jgi:hypothetical protein
MASNDKVFTKTSELIVHIRSEFRNAKDEESLRANMLYWMGFCRGIRSSDSISGDTYKHLVAVLTDVYSFEHALIAQTLPPEKTA